MLLTIVHVWFAIGKPIHVWGRIRCRLEMCSVLILLLSKNVLYNIAVLYELYWAHEHKLPIVIIKLEGEGFDYAAAKGFLADLEGRLCEQTPGVASQLRHALNAQGSDLDQMGETLGEIIVNLISVTVRRASSSYSFVLVHPYRSLSSLERISLFLLARSTIQPRRALPCRV